MPNFTMQSGTQANPPGRVSLPPEEMLSPEDAQKMQQAGEGEGAPSQFQSVFDQQDKFEQEIFKRMGYNPFEIDPIEEREKAKKGEQKLFNDIFRGYYVWSERGQMTPEAKKHWENEKQNYLKYYYDKALQKKQQGEKKYQTYMGMFAAQQAAYKKDLEKRQKEDAAKIEQGKKERAAAPGEVAKLSKQIWGDFDPEEPMDRVNPDMFKQYNRVAASSGMPYRKEVAVEVQDTDNKGNKIYIDEKGKETTEPADMETAQPKMKTAYTYPVATRMNTVKAINPSTPAKKTQYAETVMRNAGKTKPLSEFFK